MQRRRGLSGAVLSFTPPEKEERAVSRLQAQSSPEFKGTPSSLSTVPLEESQSRRTGTASPRESTGSQSSHSPEDQTPVRQSPQGPQGPEGQGQGQGQSRPEKEKETEPSSETRLKDSSETETESESATTEKSHKDEALSGESPESLEKTKESCLAQTQKEPSWCTLV